MLQPPAAYAPKSIRPPIFAVVISLLGACSGSDSDSGNNSGPSNGSNTHAPIVQPVADEPGEPSNPPDLTQNPGQDSALENADGDPSPPANNPSTGDVPQPLEQQPLPNFITVSYQFTLPDKLAMMYSEQMIYLQVWSGTPDNSEQWAGDIIAGSNNTQWQITIPNLPVNEANIQIGVDARLDSAYPHRRISKRTRTIDYEGRLLARASSEVFVASQSSEYSIRSLAGEFSTDFDDDNDGRSNLNEAYHGTDLLNPGYDFPVSFIRGSVPPVIDGDFTDAGWHPWRPTDSAATHPTILASEPLRIKSEYSQATGEFDNLSPEFFHRFQVSHDSTTLYIGVVTEDYTPWFDSGNEWWNDDGIEIFIDSDNSRQRSYDGFNDIAFAIRPLAIDYSTAELNLNTNSAALPDGLQYAVSMIEESSNNVIIQRPFYEIAIPFADLGLYEGAEFGLEIQINSDANGGDRDAKWNRNGPRGFDEAWRNPAYFSFVRIEP